MRPEKSSLSVWYCAIVIVVVIRKVQSTPMEWQWIHGPKNGNQGGAAPSGPPGARGRPAIFPPGHNELIVFGGDGLSTHNNFGNLSWPDNIIFCHSEI